MTSAINTNGINVNYPVPGVNNNSQGFRDNFAAIRTNLNTSATEITDLQNKVVVKQALDGTVVNNDMANTVISNAVTRSFRASTYNLGNALSGTVVINASLGDVQYGTIASNTTIQFGGWAPAGTQSNLELALSFSNSSAYVTFPAQVVNTDNFGALTIENGANIGNVLNVTVPYGVTLLNYRLSTLDCGNTITIEPINRPREATQIDKRTPPSTGYLGDVVGTFCIDPAQTAQPTNCTATEATYDKITCVSTTGFYLDMPIVFTGTSFDANIVAGTTYYVRTVPSSTTFTISSVPGTVSGPGTIVQLVGNTGNMTATPIQYMYASTGNYDATTVTRSANNTIAVSNSQSVLSTSSTGNLLTVTDTANSAGYAIGDQVTFTSTSAVSYATATYATDNVITVNDATLYTVGMPVKFGGLIIGGSNLANVTTYYVTNIYTGNSNITVSTTYNGSNVVLTSATGNMSVTYGNTFGGISSANTYYIQSIPSGNTFTISATQGGAQLALTSANGPASGAQAMTATVVTDSVITLNNTGNLVANDPIVFTGNVFGGVTSGQPYYITDISGSNISVSQTRYNGVAGQKLQVSTANGTMAATSLQGTDIWKGLPLNPW